MPRKQAATTSEEKVEGNESYLDNFLASVTEDVNLPADLKRNLSQLKELDAQSQELFERMQRLSKNHIAKAKRSVQDGREPDEEYLSKARKCYRELMELDEEKVHLADQMHSEVARHYEHCASELRKFEEELKEKGQLKTPQARVAIHKHAEMKTNLSRQDSSHGADAAGAAGASTDAPPVAGVGGRRGRHSGGGETSAPAQPTSANSHKRGRGRKVSFKEAERQRLAAETAAVAAAAAAAAPPPLSSPAVGDVGGGTAVAPGSFNYSDPQLPLAPREDCNAPLCGAVPASQDYVIPDHAKVCAKPPNNRMQPQDWILATVLKYNQQANKYTIVDEDEEGGDPWSQEPGGRQQHVVSARMVMPLPTHEPSVYTPYNEFARGQWVLALYPDTTCFYKALVHTPPSEMQAAPRDYIVEFEDEAEASGKGEPMRVPQKYVLRLP